MQAAGFFPLQNLNEEYKQQMKFGLREYQGRRKR